jgi:hypothetical protein
MLLGHRPLPARVAARGHARGDGSHRGGVQRVRRSSPLERRQREFAVVQRARSQPAHPDALTAEHHAAGGAAAANGSTIRIGHALVTAQRDAIVFHHRGQHLLACEDAQAQERIAHVAQYALHGHRDLNLRGRYGPHRGLCVRRCTDPVTYFIGRISGNLVCRHF